MQSSVPFHRTCVKRSTQLSPSVLDCYSTCTIRPLLCVRRCPYLLCKLLSNMIVYSRPHTMVAFRNVQGRVHRSGRRHVTHSIANYCLRPGAASRRLGGPPNCYHRCIHQWLYRTRHRPLPTWLDRRVYSTTSCQRIHDRISNQHRIWSGRWFNGREWLRVCFLFPRENPDVSSHCLQYPRRYV